MSIDTKQLKLYVVIPTLTDLNLWSDSATNLLLGTCAQESAMGTYLKQVVGPALGIYQIEPATHADVWDNYLRFKPDLAHKVLSLGKRDDKSLITNLAYATAIARIIYLRVAAPLPGSADIEGLARYWKQYYNTPLGKGCVADFIANYKKYVNA
jgi:hypothetical protein